MAPPKASNSAKGQRVVIRTLGLIKGSLICRASVLALSVC